MPRSRILIVDDHEFVRVGVRTLLAGDARWEVCGEASDGLEAVQKVAELSPDAVVLDLTMPKMNGYEAAAEMKRISPSIKIVIFSMHDIPESARKTGADAFVTKSSASGTLVATLERVLQRKKVAGASSLSAEI